jgi:magnesium-protoporphyrin O-methyltransferase
MPGCCDPRGCDRFFDRRFARRVASRYRKRGLDKTADRMVGFLERQGIAGATVLEIGGGVGEIHLELLRRGAARAVNLELSPAYDAEAARLAAEVGVEARVERRLHDIAADPEAIEAADIVVLHRVVCCYPDYERLLAAAAAHARRLLVFSHPRRNLASRLVVGAENLGFRLSRREFRVFAHPPAAMVAVLGERGLEASFHERGLAWEARGLSR